MTQHRRVIVFARVTDIPGDALARPCTLGNFLCNHELGRDLDLNGADQFDYVHIPPGFDSENPVNRWFVYDLGVTGPLNETEVSQNLHCVYLCSFQGDDP